MAIVGTAYISTKVISSGLSKQIKDEVEKSFKEAEPGLKQASRDLGGSIGKEMSEGQHDELAAGAERNSRDSDLSTPFNETGREGGRQWGRGFGDGSSEENEKTKDRWSGFFKGVMPAFKLSGATLGIGFGNALVSQGVALIGALGPAVVGAAGVAAGSIAALGAAGLAVMLAFKTESPMLDRFKESAAAIKEEFSAVGLAVQEKLLPKLGQAMGNMTALIPTLSEGLAGVGDAVGDVAIGFSEMVTEADNMARIKSILTDSAPVTRDFGGAMTNLAESALVLLKAAMPLTKEFAAWVNKLTAGWTESLKAAEASGKLADFMERAGESLKQLGRIFRDFGVALFNIFSGGADEGQNLLDKIEGLAKKFREWTESIEGQAAISDWFAQGEDVATSFYGLIKQIGPSIMDLVNGLTQMAGTVAAVGLPSFIGLLTLLVNVLNILMDIPIVGQLIAFGLAFLPIIMMVQRLMVIFKAFQTMMMVFRVVMMSTAIITGLSLGPILLIIAGIAALIAIVVLMIKHWDTIKEVMLNVWEAVKEAIGVVWEFIQMVFTAVWGFLVTVWTAIKDFIIAVWDWVVAKVMWVWETYVAIWTAIFEFLKGIFDGVIEFIGAAWDWIVDKVKWVWDTYVSIWTAIFDFIKGIFDKVKEWIGAVWDWVVDKIKRVWDYYVIAFTAIWEFIKSAFQKILDWIRNVWDWVIQKVQAVWDFYVGVFQAIWDFIKAIFQKVLDWIRGVWDWVIQKATDVYEFYKGVFTNVWNFIKGIFQKVKDWIGDVWDGVKEGAKAAFDWVKDKVDWVKDKITAAFGSVKSFITGVWDGIVSAVKGAINLIIGGINVFIRGINSMGDLVAKIPGVPDIPNIPEIPKLAKGGVVSPSQFGTLAMIGEGGRAERIEPLDSNGLSKRDRALIAALGGAANLTVRVYIGNREITEIVRVEQERRDTLTAHTLSGGRALAYGGV